MAGRYDRNPFEEEEVNPFSVSSSLSPNLYFLLFWLILVLKFVSFYVGCEFFPSLLLF